LLLGKPAELKRQACCLRLLSQVPYKTSMTKYLMCRVCACFSLTKRFGSEMSLLVYCVAGFGLSTTGETFEFRIANVCGRFVEYTATKYLQISCSDFAWLCNLSCQINNSVFYCFGLLQYKFCNSKELLLNKLNISIFKNLKKFKINKPQLQLKVF